MLLALLGVGCSGSPAPSEGARQVAVTPEAPVPVPAGVVVDAGPPKGGPGGPAVSEASAACPGGLDVPAFDPASAPWWSSLTHEQRDALAGTSAGDHWSAVAKAPIVLHRAKSGLVLRSVDGCWRQELNAERPPRLLVDGPSGIAWEYSKGRVRLFDLLAPAAPLTVVEGVSASDLVIAGDDEEGLLAWNSDRPGTGARAKSGSTLTVRWTAKPRLELREGPGAASPATDLPFAPGAEPWLVAQSARRVPAIRLTRLGLSRPAEPASASTPGSRCTDPALCLGAAPFGASSLELVRYGEIDITKRDDGAMGPLCAIFDPASGTWYEDATLAVAKPDPRQFTDERNACEGGWTFDVTGRAYLRGGQVCVASRCIRVEGEPLGFVRGNVVLGG
jgi:hypothetical protein